MDMTELDTVISEVRALDPAIQKRVTVAIADLVKHARDDAVFENELREDAPYRAYVEAALSQSQTDVEAGCIRPVEDVFYTLIEQHRARHGL